LAHGALGKGRTAMLGVVVVVAAFVLVIWVNLATGLLD
jgi:hypothetical protein